MIAYIRGNVVSSEENTVILECFGIGYEIHTTGREISRLISEGADEVLLYTHLQIREDERVLFGFSEKSDLNNFKRLISVNGVGPKAALSVMNALTAEELYLAVQSGDSKTIGKANGIGPKTAQRIVMELKDALDPYGTADIISSEDQGSADGNVIRDVTDALEALGYSRTEAMRAVRGVKGGAEMKTEELLSAALRKL